MNSQRPLRVERTMPKDQNISIEEVFYTLQGEGPFAGEVACFVRLSGCTLQCHFCVVGTTKISCPGKNKPISQLNVGELVYSFNTTSQSIELKPVINVMKRETDTVIKVTGTGTTKLYATPEHPIFVKGVGWVEVQDLKVGDVIFHITPSDKMSLHKPSFDSDIVTGLEIINPTTNPKAYARLAGSLSTLILVYNIEVENNQNYFANSYLVHNCDTSYSSHHRYSVEEVVEQAVKAVPEFVRLCVVTGGEPFRQFLMPELVKKLLERFSIVQVETSGSCFQRGFKELEYGNRIVVVCSPKTGKLHEELVPLISAYKYVVRAGFVGEDGLPVKDGYLPKVARPVANWTGRVPPIYIAPWDEGDAAKNWCNTEAAVQCCLSHGYILSLQLHKLVNLS